MKQYLKLTMLSDYRKCVSIATLGLGLDTDTGNDAFVMIVFPFYAFELQGMML